MCVADGFLADNSGGVGLIRQWYITQLGLYQIGLASDPNNPPPNPGSPDPGTGIPNDPNGSILNLVQVLERVLCTPTPAAIYASNVSAIERMRITASQSVLRGALIMLRELARLSSGTTPSTNYALTLRTGLALRTRALRSLIVLLRDQLGISTRTAEAIAVTIVTPIRVAGIAASSTMISIALAQRFGLSAGAIPHLGMLVAEGLTFDDSATWVRLALARIAEEAHLVTAAQRTLTTFALEKEGLELDDESMLEVMYATLLEEGIFVGPLAEPDGGITAWALNARTGAVTHYDGWDFNSYARFDGRYIAASMGGLFELVGDRDQEKPILVRIGKDRIELTGSNLTGLKAAYLAIRGKGEMFLTIEGERQRTTYRVALSTMKTSRVDLGKGWRTRFFSWQLETLGQDFDLQGLEFLPIQFVRRVGS